MRSANVVSDFFGDLRYARRSLRRSPGFAVLAIAIMALGIGANTAVFSVVNAVLLKPLPYPGADRIVTVSTALLTTGERNPLVTIANFRDWRAQSASFEAMATYRGGDFPATPGDTAEYARAAIVDGGFFRVFAVEPIIGRTFTPEETVPGGSNGVALISHAYWQSRYGGDPRVLERTIRVNVEPRLIVGRAARGFPVPARGGCLASRADAFHQPHEPRFLRGWAAERRCFAGTGAGGARGDCRRPRAAVPGEQQGARHRLVGSAGSTRGRRAPDALPAVGCGGCRAVDRLRQHRHAAAGQGDRTRAAKWPSGWRSARAAAGSCGK